VSIEESNKASIKASMTKTKRERGGGRRTGCGPQQSSSRTSGKKSSSHEDNEEEVNNFVLTKIIRSKRGVLKPLKLNNQSQNFDSHEEEDR
jgi:hypothetical protein